MAYKGTVISNGEEVDHLKSSHNGADTKLILQARDATIRGAKVLDILSPDTAVIILTLRRFPLLASTTQFVTGTGSSRRAIELKAIYEELGEATAAALPGFHAFSGAD